MARVLRRWGPGAEGPAFDVVAVRRQAGFADFRACGAAPWFCGALRGAMVGEECAQEGEERGEQPGHRMGETFRVPLRYICFHLAFVSQEKNRRKGFLGAGGLAMGGGTTRALVV